MKGLLAAAAAIPLVLMGCAQREAPVATSGPASRDVSSVSPALEEYRQNLVEGDLWQRPDLSPRDRSAVTLAALIARSQTSALAHQFDLALENGLTPEEISEIITHLAFYSGWENAMAAARAAEDVFERRGIGADRLPAASPELLPLDEEAEAGRAAMVERTWGSVAPGVVVYTEDVLFRDLWLRPALAPRDRSLVTVSALIAAGQTGQISFHLDRAMESGLTQAEASEVLTHLAFYAGWPNVFSALPVVRDVLQRRSE
jgi:4-carboxymuconolactone decarboxylase